MTVYAYARVSTLDQNVDQQIAALQKYNPDFSVTEKFTGTTTDRPKFSNLIRKLKTGDALVVREVSRLGRKTSEVLALAEDLQDRNVKLIIDNLGELDVTSQAGKFSYLPESKILAYNVLLYLRCEIKKHHEHSYNRSQPWDWKEINAEPC